MSLRLSICPSCRRFLSVSSGRMGKIYATATTMTTVSGGNAPSSTIQPKKLEPKSSAPPLRTRFEHIQKCWPNAFNLLTADVEADYESVARERNQFFHVHHDLVPTLSRTLCTGDQLLVPVGSAGSGLVGRSSDVDFSYIYAASDPALREKYVKKMTTDRLFCRKVMQEAFTRIRKAHSAVFDWHKSAIIDRARVPVIHLQLSGGSSVHVDLQFGNEHSIRNTNLIRHCVEADRRFSLLNLWAQRWISEMRLKNTETMKTQFSTYHIVMLVMHFLQCSAILPQLKRISELSPKAPIIEVALALIDNSPLTRQKTEVVRPASTDQQSPSVAELIVQFVDYYRDVNFDTSAISAGSNARITKRSDNILDFPMILDSYSDGKSVCKVAGGGRLLQEAFDVTLRAFIDGYGLCHPFNLRSKVKEIR